MRFLALFRTLAAGLLLIAAAAFSGCTSTAISRYPSPQTPATVSVASKKMSKMSELPVGAYYDEERQIVVAGHQKGLFTGILFGPIGVLAADSVNKSAGKGRFGNEAAKGADLGSILQDLLSAAVESEGRASNWSVASNPGQLQLTPYAFFTVEKSGNARLHAMIRAELPGPDGKPTWTARYFTPAPGAYPLQEDGWMTQNRFEEAMRAALSRALDACVDDTHGRFVESGQIAAKGMLPFMRGAFEVRGVLVQEQPDFIVIKFPGTWGASHVLPRTEFTIRRLDK